MTLTQAKYLAGRAKSHYPHSKSMRHQWIRKTLDLVSNGNHILQGARPDWRKPKVLV